MKLFNLFTERNSSNFRKLLNHSSKAISQIRQAPNPREFKIRKIIKNICQDVWSDFLDDPAAQLRVLNYHNSIIQHMPKFLKMKDKELKHEIEMLFRAVANGAKRDL